MQLPLNRLRIRKDSPNNTFGMVRNSGTTPHQGWDITAPVGTPVLAIADGSVVDVGNSGAYGNYVTLAFEHGGQTFYAFYAHLSVIAVGRSSVREGTLLGFTGKTGNAINLPTGEEHLHFEIRTIQNPGLGLPGRIDPGQILGFQYLSTPG